MLYRAFLFRFSHWSSRRAASPFQKTYPARCLPLQTCRSYIDASGQPPGDGDLPTWRRKLNGPAYEVRNKAVELITPPLADAHLELQEIDAEATITYNTGVQKKQQPDHPVAFFIEWKAIFQRLFPLEEFERAAVYESFASERAESLDYVRDKTFSQLRHQWDESLPSEGYLKLPRILAGCITTSADQTLRLLRALPQIYKNFKVRMDCLLYIQRVHWAEISDDPRLMRQFVFLVRKQLREWSLPLYLMEATHLDIFLHNCSTDEISKLVGKSVYADAIPNPPTILALVDHFTRHKDYRHALQFFRMLPREEIIESNPRILSRCTNLLKLDFVERKGSSQNFRILPELLGLGIRPDVILHTIVIQNACAAGMPSVAWDLFRYMQAEKLEINSVTYLVLLKDTFVRQDVRGLNEILTAIHHREDLARDPRLVGCTMNIVRNICMFERKDSAETTFSHMLAVYDRAFSRSELVKLGMVEISSASDRHSELPQPGSESLAFVIWSYVLAQRQGRVVHTLWLRLLRLIAEGDDSILQAAKHPFFYDGFLLFYGRWAHTLPKSLDVVQHMLDHDLCQPGETTWTFLICAYLKNGQHEAAEKIRDMMLDRGVTPKARWWDSILRSWPNSDIAVQARAALDWEVRQSEPPLEREDRNVLFEDLLVAEEETTVGARSELVFKGWNEMIDLRADTQLSV